tara:strand:+ start:32 stop:1357 length:1326 start_codon:yes stop_codon:yes gene_type:complete
MASAYLSRTFGTGNRRTFTISTWLKISNVSSASENEIFSRRIDSNNQFRFSIYQNKLYFIDQQSNTNNINFMSNSLRRDCNGFYHVVLRIDTTQATQTDRVKLYVNGTEETSFSTSTYPSQNYETYVNQNAEHRIGEWNSKYFDGQMAHFHFTDGYSYGPTTFGETDATTGIWKPKTAPSVTYGTNGFFLKFDNSANMGLDSGGGSNNLTTNGTIIQTKDTPSNVFATINPLDNYYQNNAFSNINNTVASHSSSYSCCLSTLGVSKGKYYVEAKVSALTAAVFGVTGKSPTSTGNNLGTSGFGIGVGENGRLRHEGTNTDSWSSTYTTNDILQVALDLDNNKFYFGINGTYQNSANPSTGSNGVTILAPSSTDTGLYFFGFSDNNSTGGSTLQYNFGQGFFGTTAVASAQTPDDGIGVFEYDPPTGYRALCTKSLNAQEYS